MNVLKALGIIIYFTNALALSLLERRNSTGLTNDVTWDPFSLSIFGQRVFILSGEFHSWRLPNPHLWSDVFQKIKANGFNTISTCISWNLYFPTPTTNNSQGDFTAGTYRDLQAFFNAARDAGLWVIARPGPYINGEMTGGGFPGWVQNIAGSLRTDNINYTEVWQPYMNLMAQTLAKNQIINGGPIILVQAENEFSEAVNHDDYMQAIINTYRAQGIVVPITFNDQNGGAKGNFSPDLPTLGSVNIYCGDSYPQGANGWEQVQSIYRSNHEAVAWSNPLCLAEFGAGYLLGWGNGSSMAPTGYEKYTYVLDNAQYEDVFYKENYAQTATIMNIYMLFGGTNWGQTPEPTVYTSYDYGGGINENRVITAKMPEMRLQGLFLRVSRDLYDASYIANGTNYTSSELIYVSYSLNTNTGAGFYFVRHNDSTSMELTTATLNVSTSQGQFIIPQNGSLTIDGREMKIIVTDYTFGMTKAHILYSTAEIMTWTTIGSTDYLILYAEAGQTGETSFVFHSSQPTVDVSQALKTSSSYANGILTLSYILDGAQYADIKTSSGSRIVVVILDKATANTWHAPLIAGSGVWGNYFSIGTNETVLVTGPYLIRDASLKDNTLELNGDLNGTTTVEFIAPLNVNKLIWNGHNVQQLKKTNHQSYVARINTVAVDAPPPLGPWKVSGSLPEVQRTFDDSNFVTANLTSTNYTNLPPLSGPWVLYSQQYGFYGGNLIWRGHFIASGDETAFNLTVQGGYAFGYSVFLNGVFVGSAQGNSSVSLTTNIWTIPNGILAVGEDNVLTVLQDHMGLVETSTNSGKEPRGIRGYSIIGGNTTFSYWKLQGNQGGALNAPDTYRGYLNEGGLYAERIGAHLPSYPDSAWETTSNVSTKGAGVNFFRTTFDYRLASNVDVPVRLAITPSAPTSNFRVQIYLNGWQLGKYINNFGPQMEFVLPAGILYRDSTNTLALSLWSLDDSGATVEGVSLVSDGTFSTSYVIPDYDDAPSYEQQKSSRPRGTVYPLM